MVICLERGGGDLYMVQLMPLPPHDLCIKIEIGLVFLVLLTHVVLEKRPLNNYHRHHPFWVTICKRFTLCYQIVVCLSVCPVCDIGVLWPNGWMDQYETWHAGRPRP